MTLGCLDDGGAMLPMHCFGRYGALTMKSPSSTATRETIATVNALSMSDVGGPLVAEQIGVLLAAARFAALILPDDNGEWDAVVVNPIARKIHQVMAEDEQRRLQETMTAVQAREAERQYARAVLAELVRLAGGSDE